jgi:hypothetical protein
MKKMNHYIYYHYLTNYKTLQNFSLNMQGICNICSEKTNVIICKICQKNACGNCLIKFTTDNKFINRNCLCGEKYMVDDLYKSFGDSFMKDTYINTIVQMKIKTFEDSLEILESYMITDGKYKKAHEELRNLQDKSIKYLTSSNDAKLNKVLMKIKTKQKEIQELQDNNMKNLDIFDNNFEDFKSFYEEDENLDDKFAIVKDVIMKYRGKLKKCDFADDVKSMIDDNLLSIGNSFFKIYKIQEACGDFRRNKELNRYRTKTSLLRQAIDCKIKKNISDEQFFKIVKNAEIISERVDMVVEYAKYNWHNIENVRIKAMKVFQEAKSFDFEEEDDKIKKIISDISDASDGTVIMNKMKERFNLTDEDLLEYWTTSISK